MSRWLLATTLFLTTAYAVIAQPFAEKADPIVGKWIWYQDSSAVFNEDGTSFCGLLKGSWQYIHNPEVQRKYRVIWKDGLFINSVVMSEDQQTLSVQDNNKVKFTARRAILTP